MTRTDILNYLASKHSLNNYLEIGVQVPEINFDRIVCKNKTGVDPDPNAKADFCMTSDEFFLALKKGVFDGFVSFDRYKGGFYDLIFIDGLHLAGQVKKDFKNSLQLLSPGGFIVCHDCNPLVEWHTIVPRPSARGHWNGDVYRFAAGLLYPKVTIDEDNGCMIVQKHDGIEPRFYQDDITWDKFDRNRKKLLHLMSWNEYLSLGICSDGLKCFTK